MSLVPTMANALLNCAGAGQFDLRACGRSSSAARRRRRNWSRAWRRHSAAGDGRLWPHGDGPVATSARDKYTVIYADEEDRLRHGDGGMADARRASCAWWMQMHDVARDMAAIGEIVIRGDIVMDGYFKEPKATAEVMTGGWLHTGDMAVWDEEVRRTSWTARRTSSSRGGENISSIEVERAIAAHPAVFECAVVSAPDEQWGEVPAAFVVSSPANSWMRSGCASF